MKILWVLGIITVLTLYHILSCIYLYNMIKSSCDATVANKSSFFTALRVCLISSVGMFAICIADIVCRNFCKSSNYDSDTIICNSGIIYSLVYFISCILVVFKLSNDIGMKDSSNVYSQDHIDCFGDTSIVNVTYMMGTSIASSAFIFLSCCYWYYKFYFTPEVRAAKLKARIEELKIQADIRAVKKKQEKEFANLGKENERLQNELNNPSNLKKEKLRLELEQAQLKAVEAKRNADEAKEISGLKKEEKAAKEIEKKAQLLIVDLEYSAREDKIKTILSQARLAGGQSAEQMAQLAQLKAKQKQTEDTWKFRIDHGIPLDKEVAPPPPRAPAQPAAARPPPPAAPAPAPAVVVPAPAPAVVVPAPAPAPRPRARTLDLKKKN